MKLSDLLAKHGACREAAEWAEPYATLAEAWAACERGDWMLWLAAKADLCTRQELILAACECARLALPYVQAGEVRPLIAIETAEAWARGEATIEQVAAATTAAAAASYAAAAVASYAFPAAATAATAASIARENTLRECADIVRRLIKVA